MEKMYKGLIDILKEAKDIVDSSNTDIAWIWSGYDTTKELLNDIGMYLNGLEQNDERVISKIVVLFAPTGPLQEISLSNGWVDRYMELSNKLDKLVNPMM